MAVKDELERGGFADRDWVAPPGPWDVAFRAGDGDRLPPLRHTLLGMNAHINYDLPQALLGSITDDEFDDDTLVASRAADHAHIDSVLVTRVGPEDLELKAVEQPGDRTTLDRLLTPFNRAGTKRFLREPAARPGTTPASSAPPAAGAPKPSPPA